MSSCYKLRTFLWRRLYLQTIRRHYLSLLAEIVFVLVVFAWFLSSDRVDLTCVKKINSTHINKVVRTYYNMEYLRHKVAVVYGPSNDRTDRLVKRLLEWMHPDIPIHRPPNENDTAEYDYEAENDEDSLQISDYGNKKEPRKYLTKPGKTADPLHYHGPIPFADSGSVVAGCRSRITSLLKHRQYDVAAKSTICIQFAADSTHEIPTGSLTYNLVVFVPPSLEFPQGVLYKMHEILEKPTILPSFYEMAPVRENILASLTIIDNAHMLLQGNFEDTTEMRIADIPADPPVMNIYEYRIGFFVATTVGFCLPLMWRIRDITMEIESGLKDLQEIMGLSSSLFWLGQFLSAWSISVVDAAFAYVATMALEAKQKKEYLRCEEEKREEYVQVHKSISMRTSYIRHADASLVIASFTAFSTCHTLLALLIACAFPLGRWAMVIAFGSYFLLPLSDGEKINYLIGGDLWGYLATSKAEKLRTAFYPNVAFSRIMKIIGIFDDFESKRAGWHITGKRALNMDNVTINEIFIVVFATAFILAVMIAYLSNVLPWTTSRPQHLLFPVTPSYWFPNPLKVASIEINETGSTNRFEAAPNLKAVIECKNLVKVYSGSTVLKNVSMTIYQSQVTILLGHNGAGKTTLMSILTGMLEPTSGLALVNGENIRTSGFKHMGFCPQFDAYFTDLTVSEQLTYFGVIRGLSLSLMPKRIKELLESMRLSHKAHAFPHQLSGGMKRKLSIALALLTRPKVLILDEPTVGLDPETRRSLWSVMKKLRGKASILLSTHDMEEADVLGDRIIVMYSGSVVCWGSPSFLKNACGVGYKLRILKEQNAFKSEAVLAVVRKVAPQADVAEDKQNE